MLFRKSMLALAVAGPLGLPVHAPLAQTPDAAPARPAVSMNEARRIAAEHGVVRVEEIALDRNEWTVEGRDSIGAEIEIRLRASDGVVTRIERERPASARAGEG